MKKFFVILSVLIMATAFGGCQNLISIFLIPNVAPLIISDPIITATEDQLYSYQVETSDPNGDDLCYYLIIKPEGMSINSENGLMIWTPTNEQVGINQVEVEISDGKLSVTQSFEIEVSNVNNPPQIISYSPVNLNIEINEGDSVEFEIQALDIDSNTTLSFQWFLNGRLVSNSTVSEDGSKSSWTYSASYGGYSQKIVKVVVSDGELEDSMQWSVTINDTTSPAQLTLNAVTSPTNVPSQTLSGTKETNTSIWINGTEIVPLNSLTYWSYSYNLSEGANNISITSRDAAGNESASITTTITLDTGAPEAPTLSAVVSPTNISPQTLSGTKETNTSIWINGTEVISINSSTNWSFSHNLSEGANNISITSRDAAGNESASITTTITLDTGAPEAPTLDAVVSPTNVTPQILSGTKETNSSILINDIEVVSINSSTNWSHFHNLSEGTNNISITSRDTLGNESSAISATIEYDTNIYVDAGNASGMEDGTKTHPFNTITEGISAVAPGKSVIVAAGTYNEQVIINKEITLQGASQDNTFITGSGLTGNLITIEDDYVTITGFTINGASSTAKGIYFDSYSSIDINNNIIQNNISYGVNYSNSSPTIENNNIKNNNYSGIDAGTGGAGIIRNNSLIFNQYGIRTCGNSSPEIIQNNISNNSHTGIYCRESATPIISYNTISNNSGYGILIDILLFNSVNPDIGGGDRKSDGQNKITGNYIHGVSNKTTRNIYAKYNWWGAAAGPKYPGNNSSSGDWAYWDKAGGNIIFTPHLIIEP
ncbi:MAG: right-handed parallel beta-helix repeat-containing protein [Candidatus Atribacteria bacterium]|nr:right-handed parallel beta-helix repeat-containing protein [Candidatus Atribacteria bacterium]